MWIDDLVTLLETAGIGMHGQNIFITSQGRIPGVGSGGFSLEIIETGGTAPENTQNSTITPAYLRPGAQVTVRASTAALARSVAESAWLVLFQVRNQFVNSGWYRRIKPLQSVFDGGTDTLGRVKYQFNVLGETSQGRVLS